jgi:hypothetical protein
MGVAVAAAEELAVPEGLATAEGAGDAVALPLDGTPAGPLGEAAGEAEAAGVPLGVAARLACVAAGSALGLASALDTGVAAVLGLGDGAGLDDGEAEAEAGADPEADGATLLGGGALGLSESRVSSRLSLTFCARSRNSASTLFTRASASSGVMPGVDWIEPICRLTSRDRRWTFSGRRPGSSVGMANWTARATVWQLTQW